eukprot:1679688-Rhodomonas_salina.1
MVSGPDTELDARGHHDSRFVSDVHLSCQTLHASMLRQCMHSANKIRAYRRVQPDPCGCANTGVLRQLWGLVTPSNVTNLKPGEQQMTNENEVSVVRNSDPRGVSMSSEASKHNPQASFATMRPTSFNHHHASFVHLFCFPLRLAVLLALKPASDSSSTWVSVRAAASEHETLVSGSFGASGLSSHGPETPGVRVRQYGHPICRSLTRCGAGGRDSKGESARSRRPSSLEVVTGDRILLPLLSASCITTSSSSTAVTTPNSSNKNTNIADDHR